MNAANRVFLNTGILYLKMLVTVGITLYTTRLVLSALGVIDYGIYNLIAGVIAMLSFLSAAMGTSTQRYLSYNQGLGNVKHTKAVFTNSLLLHIGLAFIVLVGLLIISLFLFDNFLNIPADRVSTAKAVYYFMCFTVFFTILSVPFTATLNARENMLWIAIVNVVEVVLKLMVAYLLIKYGGDKLILYGLSMTVISIICLLIYAIFCLKKYEECSLAISKNISSPLLKELSSFAGWNLFGALCGIGKTQGLAILLNVFYGAVINAAYAIAMQVSGQMNFFSATMLRALNPQIMKSEGAGDRKLMLSLSMIASKFGYYLLAFVALPGIFVMPAILTVWLKNVPEYTSIFCILILVAVMVNQITVGLDSAIQATGRIKVYMILVGLIKLGILPLGYLLLKTGYSSISVIIGYAVLEGIAGCARIWILKKQVHLSVKDYSLKVLIPVFIPTFFCMIYLYIVTYIFKIHDIYIFISGCMMFLLLAYFTGLSKIEKEKINSLPSKLICKIRGNGNSK